MRPLKKMPPIQAFKDDGSEKASGRYGLDITPASKGKLDAELRRKQKEREERERAGRADRKPQGHSEESQKS